MQPFKGFALRALDLRLEALGLRLRVEGSASVCSNVLCKGDLTWFISNTPMGLLDTAVEVLY